MMEFVHALRGINQPTVAIMRDTYGREVSLTRGALESLLKGKLSPETTIEIQMALSSVCHLEAL